MIGITVLAGCTTSGHTDSALHDARVTLGQQLFNDARLSTDGTMRCASCHIPERAYTDGRALAIGVHDQAGTRNTPSLLSIAIAQETSFFWDGRRTALEQAVLDPLTNPVEMGLPNQATLLRKLQQDGDYQLKFAQAFPGHGNAITPLEVGNALAAYVRSLRSADTAYDRYTKGDRSALDPRAQLGLAIFKGKGHCADCHMLDNSPAMLTDLGFHRSGVGLDAINQDLPGLTTGVMERALQGAAIGDRVATHADEAQLGRFNVTREPADIGLFRTPSLRGVSRTGPYMHDGSVPTLDAAIDREVYYRSLQSGRPLNLSMEERQYLRAFLEAL